MLASIKHLTTNLTGLWMFHGIARFTQVLSLVGLKNKYTQIQVNLYNFDYLINFDKLQQIRVLQTNHEIRKKLCSLIYIYSKCCKTLLKIHRCRDNLFPLSFERHLKM